jgi:hypothetical protein
MRWRRPKHASMPVFPDKRKAGAMTALDVNRGHRVGFRLK